MKSTLKTKLYRYRRIAGLAAVIGIAAIGIGAAEQSPPKVQEVEYIVQPNDTLWHIAQQYSSDDHDIREIVYNIRQDNDIGNEPLQPGRKLLIKKELLNVPASSNSQHK